MLRNDSFMETLTQSTSKLIAFLLRLISNTTMHLGIFSVSQAKRAGVSKSFCGVDNNRSSIIIGVEITPQTRKAPFMRTSQNVSNNLYSLIVAS